MQAVRIIGRSSSHFTRVTRIFAAELGVAYELQPIYDMSSLDPATYGGHPAMKMPDMRIDGRTVFGMQNVCRALARIGPRRLTIICNSGRRFRLSRTLSSAAFASTSGCASRCSRRVI